MQNTTMTTATYNAAVYVRLSKEDLDLAYAKKAESNSISNQKQLIFDFLKSKPEINIVSVRIDDGYTGTNYDRPAFQLMLDDIKAGLVNCVIVKDLSRFGREYIDAGKYIDVRTQVPGNIVPMPQSVYFDTLDVIGLYFHGFLL